MTTFLNSSYHPLFFLCFVIILLPLIAFCEVGIYSGPSTLILRSSFHEDRNGSQKATLKGEHSYLASRKFLLHGGCKSSDISIYQSKDYRGGIPEFRVEIVNKCDSGCGPHDIHVHCGWFASARLVNPTKFKRLSFDDCLVNGGNPLGPYKIITFTYSNSFMYPLAFKSAKFCS